ncbi:hypothetical protein EDD11_005518 [Mortierella claussenii]|nr:hypothetical protein EDD11_005518 [Mortierella claussenii]
MPLLDPVKEKGDDTSDHLGKYRVGVTKRSVSNMGVHSNIDLLLSPAPSFALLTATTTSTALTSSLVPIQQNAKSVAVGTTDDVKIEVMLTTSAVTLPLAHKPVKPPSATPTVPPVPSPPLSSVVPTTPAPVVLPSPSSTPEPFPSPRTSSIAPITVTAEPSPEPTILMSEHQESSIVLTPSITSTLTPMPPLPPTRVSNMMSTTATPQLEPTFAVQNVGSSRTLTDGNGSNHEDVNDHFKKEEGVLVGSVTGGVVFVVVATAVMCFLYFYKRRKRIRRKEYEAKDAITAADMLSTERNIPAAVAVAAAAGGGGGGGGGKGIRDTISRPPSPLRRYRFVQTNDKWIGGISGTLANVEEHQKPRRDEQVCEQCQCRWSAASTYSSSRTSAICTVNSWPSGRSYGGGGGEGGRGCCNASSVVAHYGEHTESAMAPIKDSNGYRDVQMPRPMPPSSRYDSVMIEVLDHDEVDEDTARADRPCHAVEQEKSNATDLFHAPQGRHYDRRSQQQQQQYSTLHQQRQPQQYRPSVSSRISSIFLHSRWTALWTSPWQRLSFPSVASPKSLLHYSIFGHTTDLSTATSFSSPMVKKSSSFLRRPRSVVESPIDPALQPSGASTHKPHSITAPVSRISRLIYPFADAMNVHTVPVSASVVSTPFSIENDLPPGRPPATSSPSSSSPPPPPTDVALTATLASIPTCIISATLLVSSPISTKIQGPSMGPDPVPNHVPNCTTTNVITTNTGAGANARSRRHTTISRGRVSKTRLLIGYTVRRSLRQVCRATSALRRLHAAYPDYQSNSNSNSCGSGSGSSGSGRGGSFRQGGRRQRFHQGGTGSGSSLQGSLYRRRNRRQADNQSSHSNTNHHTTDDERHEDGGGDVDDDDYDYYFSNDNNNHDNKNSTNNYDNHNSSNNNNDNNNNNNKSSLKKRIARGYQKRLSKHQPSERYSLFQRTWWSFVSEEIKMPPAVMESSTLPLHLMDNDGALAAVVVVVEGECSK